MSRELPPCDHDECGPSECKRPGSFAAANGYVTALVTARRRISNARDAFLKQEPQPGLSDDEVDRYMSMKLAYANGLAAARSLLGGMLDETRESHTD